MKTHHIFIFLLSSTVALGLSGCLDGCDEPNDPTVLLDARNENPTDTSQTEARDGAKDSSPELEVDSGGGSDTDRDIDSGKKRDISPRGGCPLSQEMTRAPFVCDEKDATPVSYESYTKAYQKPERHPAPATEVPTTVAEEREFAGGHLPKVARRIGLSPKHEPLVNRDVGFAEWGEDVTLHIATIHPRDSYGDSKLEFFALLNYRPTEAVYEHYKGDRSEVLSKKVGLSAKFPVDGPVELVDITIPAEAFDRRGRYDFAFGWSTHGPLEYSDQWQSKRIYYGGCSPPKHQCATPGELKEFNEQERTIFRDLWVTANLYPGGKWSGKAPFEPIKMETGGEVTVQYGLLPKSDRKSSWMLVPIVDGKPLDKRHVRVTPRENESTGLYVGARGEFTVPIPDEPGTYEVEVATWGRPFLSYQEETEFNLTTPGHQAGTNTLKFVVQE